MLWLAGLFLIGLTTEAAFAGQSEYASARALYAFTVAKHLVQAYSNSECKQFIEEGRPHLTNSINDGIAEIIADLRSQDRAKFEINSNSNETIQRMRDMERTYIHQPITNHKHGKGGIAFACGVAYGNVRMKTSNAIAELMRVRNLRGK